MTYGNQFLMALLLTIFIETAGLFLIIRWAWKKSFAEMPNALLIFSGIFCQVCTLPYLWFVFPLFIKTWIGFTAAGELSAVLAEAIIYSVVLKINIKRSLALSFFCNACSFLIGFLI